MKFYCVRCRKSFDIPESEVDYRMTKNGRRQAVAKCPSCGGMMYKFVKAESPKMRESRDNIM
jgi:hypothetical protein